MQYLIPDRRALLCQLRRIALTSLAVLLLTVMAGLSLVFLYYQTSIDPTLLVGDVFTLDRPAYTGFYSNIGILLWAASATVCLQAAALLWRTPRTASTARLLLALGTLSAMLCLDDMFVIHERVGRSHARLGRFLEAGVFVIFAVLALVTVVRYWSVLRQTEFLLLGTAGAGLATSVLIDVVIADQRLAVIVAEDLAKLGGILFWLVYAVRTSTTRLRSAIHNSTTVR